MGDVVPVTVGLDVGVTETDGLGDGDVGVGVADGDTLVAELDGLAGAVGATDPESSSVTAKQLAGCR